MRQLIPIALVVYSCLLIRASINQLPRIIPTHFNAAGVADAWGSPDVLWILLGAQALTCALFLLVPFLSRRAPGAVHVGSRRLKDFPPAQRGLAISILTDMTACLNIIMNLFFVWILREIIRAATQVHPRIRVWLPLGLLITGTLGLTIYYLGRFRRLAAGG